MSQEPPVKVEDLVSGPTSPIATSSSQAKINTYVATPEARPSSTQVCTPTGSFLGSPSKTRTSAYTPSASPSKSPRKRASGKVKGEPPRTRSREDPYHKYGSALEIDYKPDGAIDEGQRMLKGFEEKLNSLEMSHLRQQVWHSYQETLLACAAIEPICIPFVGPTGAGKSWVVNALLRDNILPTSGMEACTPVPFKIYHSPGSSIVSDFDFLDLHEWKAELDPNMAYLKSEAANGELLEHSKDKLVAAAWQKVNRRSDLASMSTDEIIDRFPDVKRRLGTTEHLICPNSKEFREALDGYLKPKSKRDHTAPGATAPKEVESALWPLIREIRIGCPAEVLSTGAVFMDLPGTGDTNAARSAVSQRYMGMAKHIFIVSQIQRAINDKNAHDIIGDFVKVQLTMDQNYNSDTLTFVATKTDDVSCNELIDTLQLADESDLQIITRKLDALTGEERKFKKEKSDSERNAKNIEREMKAIRKKQEAIKAQITSLKSAGDSGESTFATLGRRKRRKSHSQLPEAKRNKSGMASEGPSSGDDGSGDNGSGEDSVSSDSCEDMDSDSSDHHQTNGSEHSDDDMDSTEVTDAQNPDISQALAKLRKEIETLGTHLSQAGDRLKEYKAKAKETDKEVGRLAKKVFKAQRDLNGYCARARNKYAQRRLQEDWRSDLRNLDQEAALRENPATFDPSVSLRDYAAVNLPVFTVSAREYLRHAGQLKQDGKATSFSDVNDTEIPKLQEYCHHLTLPHRERRAKRFLELLRNFVSGVQVYVDNIAMATAADRAALHDQWASEAADRKMPEQGGRVGITLTLKKALLGIVEELVEELQEIFKAKLTERLEIGSRFAAIAALETVTSYTTKYHSNTYRAYMRHDGVFRRDNWNQELCLPLIKNIASSWVQVFEQDLFGDFAETTTGAVKRLIEEVVKTAPIDLKDKSEAQGMRAMDELKTTMDCMVETVRAALQEQQRAISRSLAPHVQECLTSGYEEAAGIRGPGCVKRQQDNFYKFVEQESSGLFLGVTSTLLDRLASTAKKVGKALGKELENVAKNVEVMMAVLWEGGEPSPSQVTARAAVSQEAAGIIRQVDFWVAAEKSRMVLDVVGQS